MDRTNSNGDSVKLGSTNLFYCGKKNAPCHCFNGGCDGRCGPTEGCQCLACEQLSLSLGAKINAFGVISTKSNTDVSDNDESNCLKATWNCTEKCLMVPSRSSTWSSTLKFSKRTGVISGLGTDNNGRFSVDGKFDTSGEVTFQKNYGNGPIIKYRGRVADSGNMLEGECLSRNGKKVVDFQMVKERELVNTLDGPLSSLLPPAVTSLSSSLPSTSVCAQALAPPAENGSSTGKWYCFSRDLECSCDGKHSFCAPSEGCNCRACAILDQDEQGCSKTIWRATCRYDSSTEVTRWDCNLTIEDATNRLYGYSDDNFGRFCLIGRFDPTNQELFFSKLYSGSPAISFVGCFKNSTRTMAEGQWSVADSSGRFDFLQVSTAIGPRPAPVDEIVPDSPAPALRKELEQKIKALHEATEEVDRLREELSRFNCPICYVKEVTHCVQPCGHTFCSDCLARNKEVNGMEDDEEEYEAKCMYCNEDVDGTSVRVFFNGS